jgi:hypothetical protein
LAFSLKAGLPLRGGLEMGFSKMNKYRPASRRSYIFFFLSFKTKGFGMFRNKKMPL